MGLTYRPIQVRKKVGYLPEHNPLYLDMYVREFLAFVGQVYQLKGKSLKDRISEVIQQTGLTREQHKKIGALSKGYIICSHPRAYNRARP